MYGSGHIQGSDRIFFTSGPKLNSKNISAEDDIITSEFIMVNKRVHNESRFGIVYVPTPILE